MITKLEKLERQWNKTSTALRLAVEGFCHRMQGAWKTMDDNYVHHMVDTLTALAQEDKDAYLAYVEEYKLQGGDVDD